MVAYVKAQSVDALDSGQVLSANMKDAEWLTANRLKSVLMPDVSGNSKTYPQFREQISVKRHVLLHVQNQTRC